MFSTVSFDWPVLEDIFTYFSETVLVWALWWWLFVWAFSVYMFKIPKLLIFISFCVLESCQVWAISYSEIECYVQNCFKMSKITFTLWYSFVHGIKASVISRLESHLQHTSLHIDKYSKSVKIIPNPMNVWFQMSWPRHLHFWDCSMSVRISRTSVWLVSPQRSLKRLLNPRLHRSTQTWLHARATWGVLELLMPGAHAPGFWWNCSGNSLVTRSSKSFPVEPDAHLEERAIGRCARKASQVIVRIRRIWKHCCNLHPLCKTKGWLWRVKKKMWDRSQS